jgi:hypothetical protein
MQRLREFAQRIGEQTATIFRAGSFGEAVTELLTMKQWKLSEEASYFVTRSPTVGTGIATAAAPTSYVSTTPFMVIQNMNQSGGRCLYLDYIKLTCTLQGTGGTALYYATMIDSILRWSSGGSGSAGTGQTSVLAGPYPTKSDAAPNSSALVYAGAVTAAGNGSAARLLSVGVLRSAVIPVVFDTYLLNFGGVNLQQDSVLTTGSNVAQRSLVHPPVCVGPGGSFILNLWLPSQGAASIYEIEIGHVEK